VEDDEDFKVCASHVAVADVPLIPFRQLPQQMEGVSSGDEKPGIVELSSDDEPKSRKQGSMKGGVKAKIESMDGPVDIEKFKSVTMPVLDIFPFTYIRRLPASNVRKP
jgi:hypothetical protein